MYVSSISPLTKTKPKFPFRHIVNSQSNLTKQEAGTGHGRLGSYGVGKLARISKEDRYEKFRQNSKEKFAHLNSLEKNESNYPNLSDGHDQRLSQQSDQISRSAVNSISGAHRSKLPISNGGCGVQKDSKRLSSLVNSTFDDASEKVRENLPNRPGIFCEESMEKFRENNIEIFRKAFVDSHYLVKAGREGLFNKSEYQESTKNTEGKIVSRICHDQSPSPFGASEKSRNPSEMGAKFARQNKEDSKSSGVNKYGPRNARVGRMGISSKQDHHDSNHLRASGSYDSSAE